MYAAVSARTNPAKNSPSPRETCSNTTPTARTIRYPLHRLRKVSVQRHFFAVYKRRFIMDISHYFIMCTIVRLLRLLRRTNVVILHRIQSTGSDATVLYDCYISGRRVKNDVPVRTLTVLGVFEARGLSTLHEVLVTQIRPARKETPVRTQVETTSRLNPFLYYPPLILVIMIWRIQ